MTASPGEPSPATAPATSPALRPAATLVLLRPAGDGAPGFEVLLTKRPDSMRFGPGMYVFPGGRIEAGERARAAAMRETVEETGIGVPPTSLVAMTRWVTPYGLPARYDARFFAAIVAAGTDVGHGSDEVAGWTWLRPTAALEGMAAGRLPMWQPTVVTLQQLESIGSGAELRAAFRPGPALDSWPVDGARPRRQFDTAWAGGIRGRQGTTRAFGAQAWVVVDPPDPTDRTITAMRRAATEAGATIAGVVISDLAPEHHAGVELFARGLSLPVAGPPGASALVPYEVMELEAGQAIAFGDAGLRVAAVEPAADAAGERRWAGRAARLRLEAR